MRTHLSFIFLLFICFQSLSQVVETIVSHQELRDGLHVDSLGNIYTTSGGFAGFEIGKYSNQSDEFDPNFAVGFLGPVDVDQYHDSLLIVTNYDNNTASSYNLNSGESEVVATGLDGPSGIVIDSLENIYIANWGNAPAYAGHEIHKISSTGQFNLYIDSPLLYRPQAMTTNLEGSLVIHSNENLYTVNASDSTLQLWVNLNQGVGHMVFRELDSCIYASANNRILKIEPSGAFSVFGGSTAGYQDGPIETAKFQSLLGIEFSPDEDTLYVCDSGYGGSMGRLRRIIMDQTTGLEDLNQSQMSLFPNPIDDYLQVASSSPFDQIVILDLLGKRELIKSWNNSATERRLNIQSLSGGVYFIRLQDGERFLSEQKLLKN